LKESSTGSNSTTGDADHEIRAQISSIYKQVNEMLHKLRQGEDEAQVEMLQYENFVIAQEKMQMFRAEIG
jgi:hypothetical protein